MIRLLILVLTLSFFDFPAQDKPELIVSSGHTGFISSVAVDENGGRLLTGSLDLTAKLWDLKTGAIIRTFSGMNGRVECVAISPKGTYVAVSDAHNYVYIFETKTGEMIYNFETNSTDSDLFFISEEVIFYQVGSSNSVYYNIPEKTIVNEFTNVSALKMCVSPDRKTMYAYDYKYDLRSFDVESGKMIDSVRVIEEDGFAYSNMAISKDGKLISFALADHEIRLYNTKDLTRQKGFVGDHTQVKSIAFDDKSDKLFSCHHSGEVKVWDIKSKKEIAVNKSYTFGAQNVIAHPQDNQFIISEGKSIRILDVETANEVKSIVSESHEIVKMAYDSRGKFVAKALSSANIELWDMEQNKVVGNEMTFFPVKFTPDGYMISMGMNLQLRVFDPIAKKVIKSLPTDNELIQNIAISSDANFVSGGGFQGVLRIWNLETGKSVAKVKAHEGGIYGTGWSPNGTQIATVGMDCVLKIWNTSDWSEIHSAKDQSVIISDVEYSPDGKFLATSSWDKTVNIYNTETWELVHQLTGHTNSIWSIEFSPDGKYLASSSGNNSVSKTDNNIRIWDVSSGQQICVLSGHTGTVTEIAFDKESGKLISGSNDGMLKVWDVDNCSEIASIISFGNEDFIVVTPDMYYMATKGALENVSFRVGGKVYPFEQFDLRLNRPDIVSSRIGKTPKVLINAYERAYRKRLKRMNFTEEMLGTEFKLPRIQIVTDNIPLVTKENKLSFKVRATDDDFLLDRLQVYVNDVPVYGRHGVDLKTVNTKDITYQIDAVLIPGKNKIQVSVLNQKGVESLKETVEVLRDVDNLPNLYLVAMGVSKYENDDFSLKYPSKDAADVISNMKQQSDIYKSVNVLELTDEEVTKVNFSKVSDFLTGAGPDDIVIVFVAGHGVLDEDLNYFFGTYDMDFDNPNEKGLPYEDIEAIFYKVKSIKKLLIMDTCHSGEVDKDEVEKVEPTDVEVGDIQFRAAGVGVRKKEAFGLENSYDMMENLFSDIRRGSGATVISSAGGAEYAMESDKWQNGLFTYCLLNGLSTKAADLNKDGEIVVSELRKYVYTEVSSISGGKQKPTTRIENISLDYRVW